jgi:sugar lactone lactonase YvrE
MATNSRHDRGDLSSPPPWKTRRAAVVVAVLALAACATTTPLPTPDIVVDGDRVFPESVTSTSDGRVIVGSVFGAVYRSEPGAATATRWIDVEAADGGDLAVFGVLADEVSDTLWVCTSGNPWGETRTTDPVALRTFDLASGAVKAVYPFPPRESGGNSVCNDVAIAADGTAYVADTQGARILKLPAGADALVLLGADPALGGVDGIAFSADGTLYVNTVTTGLIIRVGIEGDGSMGALTTLTLDTTLGGPDGMRLIEGDRFLLAEGQAGRLSIIDIEGDTATMTVLKDDLESSPGATPVGDTAYVLESQIGLLFDPAQAGQTPGPFIVYAVPMTGGE